MDPSSLTLSFWRFVAVIAALAACLLAGAVTAPTASAISFTVSTSSDDVDASAGDGACATASGDCTLRAAVMETNATPGWDKIVVARSGAQLTLAGRFEDAAATGDLDVTDDLTVIGRGGVAVIGGRGFDDRIFDVDPAFTGISVRMLTLTIARGDAFGTGGGIENHATASLALQHVVLRSNRVSGAIANLGGAIENDGALVLYRTEVLSNEAAGNMFSVGGGISNGGTLTVIDSTIAGNRSEANGGGVYNGAPGTASITGSTIAANSSGHSGGGVWNRGELTMENATISGNNAVPWGGGLNNTLGMTTLSHVTVTENSAGLFGSGINSTGNIVEVRNSIVGDNKPGSECVGTLTSGGGNLDGDASCGFTQPTDISGTSPELGPLAANGGPTLTHAPWAGSPVIDAAVTANCAARDQRGMARPQGGACDMGAHEAP